MLLAQRTLSRFHYPLGLPTSSHEALEISSNKHRTRTLEPGHLVSSVAELEMKLRSLKNLSWENPMVVKPCQGWGSKGVCKVQSQGELVREVERLFSREPSALQSCFDVVIEPYVSGPEIDCNIILWDGDVLFCEIADDFPSRADDEVDQSAARNFLETQIVFPTRSPRHEVSQIQSDLHQTLL